MITLPFTPGPEVAAAVAASARARSSGGVILLPTETYYGLGVDPASAAAVDRVRAAKGRPAALALPVLAADWQQLEALVEVPDRYRIKLGRLWPGAITVVLPTRRPLAAGGDGTLAVRIPDHDRLRALLYRVGPLTGTSANAHGQPPATTVAAALGSLLEAPDLVLDGATTPGGDATTLVDLSGAEPRVLRQGSTPWEDANPLY